LDDIEFLKAHIPGFEGYAEEAARHHTDQRVRAWVGSELADVQVRLDGSLDSDAENALEAAIMRSQFPDQTYTTRLDVADVTPEEAQRLAEVDRQLVELADRAKAAAPADLPAILRDIDAAFDRRRKAAPVQPPVD
jgi:hypothetical protein